MSRGERLRRGGARGSCTIGGNGSDVRVQPTSGGKKINTLLKPIRLWRRVYVSMFAVVYTHNMKLICVYAERHILSASERVHSDTAFCDGLSKTPSQLFFEHVSSSVDEK